MQNALPILKKCTETTTCAWPEFIELINELIRFSIYIAISLATLTIAYAGVKLLMSGGSSGERSAAKSMIWNAILGIIVTMTAWIIVQFILTNLGLQNGYSLLG